MKVKIIRLWPVSVIIFCFYCLYTLVSDSYEVHYLRVNETDPIQFLACEELSRVCPNRAKFGFKELRGRLYRHFNSSMIYRSIREGYYTRISFQKLILNLIKSGGYLVLNRRVCLIAMDQQELYDIYNLLFVSKPMYNYSLVYKPVLFAMKNDTFDFVRMKLPRDPIDQQIVKKMGRPYSDCDESNGRFLCLNECFRSHFRLSRYFYQANETGSILLHFSESNRMIQESERICFAQCKRENCKLVQLTAIHFPSNSRELKKYKPKTETFEAEPVLSAFDFWVEIIGLIFSFVGLFFDKSASAVTKLAKSRVRRRKVKVGLFYLNVAIILLSLAYCGYLCVQVALDQQTETNNLPEMTSHIYSKTVHLTICVLIKSKDYEGKTMWEIERATNRALNDTLEGIYVVDGWKSFRTDYQVHPKILFKRSFGKPGRCFPLSIHWNYQTIPSRPKLTVRFKEHVYNPPWSFPPSLYVLFEEEDLNSKSFYFDGFDFQKRIVKRLKSRGCVSYKAKYENCTGRQNCVDRCIARKFIKRYSQTTFGTYDHPVVIGQDWFSPSEWNISRLMILDKPLHLGIYLNISGECEEEFLEKECDETKFERTVKIKPLRDPLTVEIDLQLDVVKLVEELPYSLRMALDLLGIQSIFFAFTLLQLFWMVYQFTKPRWRWRLKDKTDKVVWFIVSLLASIGCSWTTVRMLNGIVNGELVPTEHYEVAERVQMPAMVFCHRIDQKLVDRNHQLTCGYLEKLTGHITTESTFRSIIYLNESNEWTFFDLRRVERFFLSDMKCFRVHIEGYDRNQFHFLDYTEVLRVNFWKKIRNELVGFVHFMTQSNETGEFSKVSNLDYSWFNRYEITHESSLYEHEDRFGFFRKYFPPLPEGDVGDLRGQLLELQANEPQRKTLSLPVEEEHFGVEVDEDRFEQLHYAQRKNLNKRTNLNYRQIFHLLFLRRVMHFTNEVNYATLTLALLNLLSLWLELGGLDLRPFLVRLHNHFFIYLYLHLPVLLLRRLIKVLLFFHRWLKRVKPHLYERIDPQPFQLTQPTLSLIRAGRAQSAPVSRRFQSSAPRLSASARLPPQAHQDPALLQSL